MAQEKSSHRKTHISYDKNGRYDPQYHTNQSVSKKVNQIISMANYDTDPLGSYTGLPENNQEIPTQDADDL